MDSPADEGAFYRVDTEQLKPLYVLAKSHEEARKVVVHRGREIKLITRIRASEIPPEAEIVGAPTRAAPASPEGISTRLARVEESVIMKHPYLTIAMGVVLGNFLTFLVLFLLGLRFPG